MYYEKKNYTNIYSELQEWDRRIFDSRKCQSADSTTKKMNVHPTYHGCWTYNDIQLSRTIPSLSLNSTKRANGSNPNYSSLQLLEANFHEKKRKSIYSAFGTKYNYYKTYVCKLRIQMLYIVTPQTKTCKRDGSKLCNGTCNKIKRCMMYLRCPE